MLIYKLTVNILVTYCLAAISGRINPNSIISESEQPTNFAEFSSLIMANEKIPLRSSLVEEFTNTSPMQDRDSLNQKQVSTILKIHQTRLHLTLIAKYYQRSVQ